jgi:hypothetical protein
MLFRGTGWLCTATIWQALAQMAAGQVGPTSPTPSAVQPGSETDARKTEEPTVEEQQPTFEQRPQPETTDMNAEQKAGWSGELSVPDRIF